MAVSAVLDVRKVPLSTLAVLPDFARRIALRAMGKEHDDDAEPVRAAAFQSSI